jgi:hypothetical protein
LQALAAANDRDDLDRKISDAEKPQNKQGDAPAATSADPDPQATAVSKLVAWVTRDSIKPTLDDIALMRIFWAMVPSLAGLILMFATPLAPARTKP